MYFTVKIKVLANVSFWRLKSGILFLFVSVTRSCIYLWFCSHFLPSRPAEGIFQSLSEILHVSLIRIFRTALWPTDYPEYLCIPRPLMLYAESLTDLRQGYDPTYHTHQTKYFHSLSQPSSPATSHSRTPWVTHCSFYCTPSPRVYPVLCPNSLFYSDENSAQ